MAIRGGGLSDDFLEGYSTTNKDEFAALKAALDADTSNEKGPAVRDALDKLYTALDASRDEAAEIAAKTLKNGFGKDYPKDFWDKFKVSHEGNLQSLVTQLKSTSPDTAALKVALDLCDAEFEEYIKNLPYSLTAAQALEMGLIVDNSDGNVNRFNPNIVEFVDSMGSNYAVQKIGTSEAMRATLKVQTTPVSLEQAHRAGWVFIGEDGKPDFAPGFRQTDLGADKDPWRAVAVVEGGGTDTAAPAATTSEAPAEPSTPAATAAPSTVAAAPAATTAAAPASTTEAVKPVNYGEKARKDPSQYMEGTAESFKFKVDSKSPEEYKIRIEDLLKPEKDEKRVLTSSRAEYKDLKFSYDKNGDKGPSWYSNGKRLFIYSGDEIKTEVAAATTEVPAASVNAEAQAPSSTQAPTGDAAPKPAAEAAKPADQTPAAEGQKATAPSATEVAPTLSATAAAAPEASVQEIDTRSALSAANGKICFKENGTYGDDKKPVTRIVEGTFKDGAPVGTVKLTNITTDADGTQHKAELDVKTPEEFATIWKDSDDLEIAESTPEQKAKALDKHYQELSADLTKEISKALIPDSLIARYRATLKSTSDFINDSANKDVTVLQDLKNNQAVMQAILAQYPEKDAK